MSTMVGVASDRSWIDKILAWCELDNTTRKSGIISSFLVCYLCADNGLLVARL